MQLAQLFPRAQVFIMTWSYAIFLFSGSTFRLWKILYDTGISLQHICYINIAYLTVVWFRYTLTVTADFKTDFRTFFLMPTGWITKDNYKMSVYELSPFRFIQQKKSLKVRPISNSKDDKYLKRGIKV